jgi:sugar fermentation stimulation protein A
VSEPYRPLGETPLFHGTFVERPNRFIMRCRVPRYGTVEAFVANPGRMDELLFPGVTPVTLTRVPDHIERRTRWTCVACDTADGESIFLDTHRTNDVAAHLIDQGLVPGLKGWHVDRREVRVGHSRFDLQLALGRRRLLVEVKSCTLFGGKDVAMFPDAVTERGRRHLEELAELDTGDERPVVLFVVHSSRIRWFMPDYHTDLAFSRTFLSLRDRLRVLPVAIGWSRDLALAPTVTPVRIPWNFLAEQVHDTGAYLLLLHLRQSQTVSIGQLGEHHFAAGFYIYVGSAMANLTKRVERHLRRRKRQHWHIDYLRQVADDVTALPIRASERQECDLTQAMSQYAAAAVDGFGSSDCHCGSHLFFRAEAPLDDVRFHRLLQRFRMRSPDGRQDRIGT